MPLSKLTIARLKQLQAAVRATPERYDQEQWCGTKHCLAGYSATLAGMRVTELQSYSNIDAAHVCTTAQQWLGVSKVQADALFAASWLYVIQGLFHNMYEAAGTDAARAEVACSRIDYFIETDGE